MKSAFFERQGTPCRSPVSIPNPAPDRRFRNTAGWRFGDAATEQEPSESQPERVKHDDRDLPSSVDVTAGSLRRAKMWSDAFDHWTCRDRATGSGESAHSPVLFRSMPPVVTGHRKERQRRKAASRLAPTGCALILAALLLAACSEDVPDDLRGKLSHAAPLT